MVQPVAGPNQPKKARRARTNKMHAVLVDGWDMVTQSSHILYVVALNVWIGLVTMASIAFCHGC